MGDVLFHEAGKSEENLEKLTLKMEQLLNNPYWPKYLYTAKLIPLSKTDSAFESVDKVRMISVLPAVTKLMERLVLNQMMEKLYGSGNLPGAIHTDQLGFRPGASTVD